MLGSDFANMSVSEVNAGFIDKTASPDGLQEVSVEGTQYIRNTLKEFSIWRQIVPPVYKRPAELFPNLDNDTLYDIIWIEAEATGQVVSFQADGNHKTVFGPRAAIHFGEIISPMWDKSITELAAYRVPITKIIEDNSLKYLHSIADTKLTLAAMDACFTNTFTNSHTQILGSTDLAASAQNAVTAKTDIGKLAKLIDGADRMAKYIMCNHSTREDLMAIPYTTVGDKETFVNGFKYNEIGGLTLVTSVKSKVFKPGLIFCATDQQFLGVYEILEEPNFFVKRENHRIQMQAREVEAFGFVNTKSLAILDCTQPVSTISGYANATDWFSSVAPTAASGSNPLNDTLVNV